MKPPAGSTPPDHAAQLYKMQPVAQGSPLSMPASNDKNLSARQSGETGSGPVSSQPAKVVSVCTMYGASS